jgi:hypothetical protein
MYSCNAFLHHGSLFQSSRIKK